MVVIWLRISESTKISNFNVSMLYYCKSNIVYSYIQFRLRTGYDMNIREVFSGWLIYF